MKRSGIILLVLLFFACETDVDLIHEAEPVPVVYCLLDPGKEIQSIRLSKSYISQLGTQPHDSLEMVTYQSQVHLAIEKIDDGQASTHTEFYPVTIEKDPGLFPGNYHAIYQAELEVAYESFYRLIIYLPDEELLIYGFTQVMGDFFIVDPNYPQVRPLHLMPDHNPVFHWTPADQATIYQLGFQLNYYESDSSSSTLKSLLIPLKTLVKRDNPGRFFTYDINSTQFYIAVGQLLEKNEAMIRSFHSLDAMVIAGGEELAVHFQIEQEGDPFRIIDYTNIQNGIGVLSSISYRYVKGFDLTGQSIDSLAYGRYTRELNFLDRDGHRKNP